MSKISQASKNIKKKLSFEDYSKPESQHGVTPAKQFDSAPVDQHTVMPVVGQASILDMPESQHVEQVAMPAKRHVGKPVGQQAALPPKVKATFYLSEADNQALMDIYIKRLQGREKTDKSALIAEAISLLYKREMRSSS